MLSVQKVFFVSMAALVANVAAQSTIITALSNLPACALTGLTTAAAATPCGTITNLNTTCACTCAFQESAITDIDTACGSANQTLIDGAIAVQVSLCGSAANITGGASSNGTCPTSNTTTNGTSMNGTMTNTTMNGTSSASSSMMSATTTAMSGALSSKDMSLIMAAAAMLFGVMVVA